MKKTITLDGIEYELTPVIKPQPELPTTVQEVYDEVKPEWFINTSGGCRKAGYSRDYAQLPTQALAEKALAYIQLLTVCHWANERFEGDGDGQTWIVDNNLDIYICYNKNLEYIYHLTSHAAAEYIKEHHLDLIKKFYGI